MLKRLEPDQLRELEDEAFQLRHKLTTFPADDQTFAEVEQRELGGEG